MADEEGEMNIAQTHSIRLEHHYKYQFQPNCRTYLAGIDNFIPLQPNCTVICAVAPTPWCTIRSIFSTPTSRKRRLRPAGTPEPQLTRGHCAMLQILFGKIRNIYPGRNYFSPHHVIQKDMRKTCRGHYNTTLTMVPLAER